MDMLYEVEAMPLFLLLIAVSILEVITGYCLAFNCNVIYPFKIPWLLFTSVLWMLILMCRACYCALRRGNETMQALLCIPYVQTILKELVMSLPPQCTTSDYPPFALPLQFDKYPRSPFYVCFFFTFFCEYQPLFSGYGTSYVNGSSKIITELRV